MTRDNALVDETQRLFLRGNSCESSLCRNCNDMDDEEKATVMLRLPSTLSAYSGGKSQLLLQAGTVEQLLHELECQHRQVWEHLCTEHGHVRKHVQIFVNNELIMGDDGLKTLLKPGQEVIVLPISMQG